MKQERSSFIQTFLPLSIATTLIGWGGLWILVQTTLPTLGPRWLFFFLAVLAFSGPSLPMTYYLNQRFPSNPPAEAAIIIRQALWVGIYFSTLAWLQLGRVLSLVLAIILFGVFALLEFLLRLFERSRWQPKNED